MATIVTVHGTFAHSEAEPTSADEPSTADLQWWQPNSAFDQDVRALIEEAPGGGPVDVKPFVWSGNNSEIERRKAGKKLAGELKALEASGEPYCLVGHSHGGSVIGWALLESAAKRQSLKGLKRWITVGSPFVALKKERFLFQRLDLMHKAIFVASFMLLAMFLVDIAAQLWFNDGRRTFGEWLQRRGLRWAINAVLMSLPIFVLYFGLKYWDSLSLLHYRRRVRERCRTYFASRWLSMTHTDDEAVQGLAFLPGAKLYFFDKSFAVSAITLLSIGAVPLLYVLLLNSPATMVRLADLLKTQFYTSQYPQTEAVLREAWAARRIWLDQFSSTPNADGSTVNKPMSYSEKSALREKYVEARKAITPELPGKRSAERALQFKRAFFELRDGTPCADGKLCGKGENIRTNSRLLLYLVTNQVTSTVVGDDSILSNQRSLWSNLIPALLVPLFFGFLALFFMLVFRAIARLVSHGASVLLNRLTNDEVKRAAFGNDTEGETAIGAVDRPMWIDRSPPRLPPPIADLVTDYSNGIASHSLAKFRRTIGQLASAEPKHTADSAITTYFTWKELVHAAYFDVPQFRKLVVQAVSQADGFAASQAFMADPDFNRTARWLADIGGGLHTPQPPHASPPDRDDAEAVSAVVASTVKAQP